MHHVMHGFFIPQNFSTKGAAKVKIQAKKLTKKAGTQLNKRRVQVVSEKI